MARVLGTEHVYLPIFPPLHMNLGVITFVMAAVIYTSRCKEKTAGECRLAAPSPTPIQNSK